MLSQRMPARLAMVGTADVANPVRAAVSAMCRHRESRAIGDREIKLRRSRELLLRILLVAGPQQRFAPHLLRIGEMLLRTKPKRIVRRHVKHPFD
jgi:hypothetical protein